MQFLIGEMSLWYSRSVIACIIEFAIRQGAEERRDQLVRELMEAVVTIDGFVSKETFTSRDNPGKLITVSYWRDAEALKAWMRHPAHARNVVVGKRSVFSHFRIQVAPVTRDIEWNMPAAATEQGTVSSR